MADNNTDSIELDDIQFDDVLDAAAGGETAADELAVGDETSESELDADADSKGNEESERDAEGEKEESSEEEETKEREEETEDEEKGEEQEQNELSVAAGIIQKLGYETEEEYADTEEGLLALTQDMGGKIAEDQLNELFANFPLVQKHMEYVANGGDSQEFMKAYDPELDYSKIQVAEEDIRSQKALLSDYFAEKGHDSNFINELLSDYEDTGKLYQKAEAAKTALTKLQQQKREHMVEAQKEQRQKDAQAQQKFWTGMHETITNADEFAGIPVPKREKSKFFDYISKPVTRDGRTQRDLDHAESEIDTKLAIDYLMYKGFDLSKMIDKKATTKNAKSLRERISKNEERVKSSKGRSKRSGGITDLDDIDFTI
tara:strand:+ start:5725 stop:6846 length:1122 start_codon:yes stop_codon:yes gene_type:complete